MSSVPEHSKVSYAAITSLKITATEYQWQHSILALIQPLTNLKHGPPLYVSVDKDI